MLRLTCGRSLALPEADVGERQFLAGCRPLAYPRAAARDRQQVAGFSLSEHVLFESDSAAAFDVSSQLASLAPVAAY